MGLKERLRGKRVYFDANIFIYLLEGNELFEPAVSQLRDLIADDQITVISSDLIYTEVLAHPALSGNKDAIEHIISFISNFDIHPVTQSITIHAGILRGETGMKTPDALHVASAVQGSAEVFLSNDKGIRTPDGVECILIKNYLNDQE